MPGLKVAAPSDPYDAMGLLRTAVADDNPTIFVEHALLYGTRGEVPNDYYSVPFGEAKVKRQGSDVTLVGTSRMVHVAGQAADQLAERGIEAEVIDLRTLRPLDIETVVESVKKTNRAVVIDEAWRTGGFGAEIAASIQEEAFTYLDGPVGRVCGADVPAPYSGTLEASAIPSPEKVISALNELFGI